MEDALVIILSFIVVYMFVTRRTTVVVQNDAPLDENSVVRIKILDSKGREIQREHQTQLSSRIKFTACASEPCVFEKLQIFYPGNDHFKDVPSNHIALNSGDRIDFNLSLTFLT